MAAAFPSLPRDQPKLVVGIATIGRSMILRDCMRDIANQTLLPAEIVICHTSDADIAGINQNDVPSPISLRFVQSPPGLPRQRNAILDAVSDADIIQFLDDDFLMAPAYLEAVVTSISANQRIVATTGQLIDDGTRGPGFSVAEGLALIAADERRNGRHLDRGWSAAPHGYGCNMAFRLATVLAHELRFDERLPLYAWSEDIDFTHRIACYGIIAKLAGARGVHLGVKHAKSPGRRLGYSQVANPLYLLQKGSYSAGRAGRSVARNMAANCARALWPEPYIDRRGRLMGNALALVDLCRGRLQPERILDL